MRIGVFDSGMGGLIILKSIIKKLPQYEYVYLGDTKNLPYGKRPQKEIYELTLSAVKYLFSQDCKIIIIACNTASASALRKIQENYLPKNYPDRRVLGVIKPVVEVAALDKRTYRIGVLATESTVKSKAFIKELKHLDSSFQVFQKAAPMLVPLIERNHINKANIFLKNYLAFLLKKNIQTLILGCTHYPILKKQIKNIVGNKIKILSQDEIIAEKLKNYLWRHPEIAKKLDHKRKITILVTKASTHFKKEAAAWFGPKAHLKLIKI
jgi:glutamate racemase